ncbi:MAG: TetR/AcrR family transcriptional regulator [Bauldia sp.]
MAGQRDRAKTIEALMTLAARQPFNQIGLADIAKEAGISLAAMREQYASKAAILSDFSRQIDKAVLEEEVDAEEPTARGRLLDLFMRRFDALAPYKPALKRMASDGWRDLLLCLGASRLAATSNLWLMAAAGIDTAGLRGALKAEALSVIYARAFRVWLKDDDPGLGATMAELDRAFDRADGLARRCDDAARFFAPFFDRLSRRNRRGEEPTDMAA